MKKTFRVVFLMRTQYTTQEGKHPIDIRIYLNSERVSLGSTGLFVSEKIWNSRINRAAGRTADAVNLNSDLSRIEADLTHIFRRLEFDENLSLDMIKAEYLGGNKSEDSFIEFFDEFIEMVKSEVGITRSQASYQKFNVLKSHFQSFLKSRCRRKELKVNELNYRILSDFENYLLTDGKCQHNTVMRMMGNFKTLTIRALRLGILKVDPFLHYKIRFKPQERGYLTEEELQILMAKEFEIKRLEFVRDVFVFSCFTGLAYIDVSQLTKDNIKEFNGHKWIMTKRQKTNVPSNVLLLDVPLQILKKYEGVDKKNRLLPMLSNQRTNAYLKEIADLCGIKKRLTYHLARHTFATLSLSNNVPIESLSRMMGHTNIGTTQHYAKIVNKKIESDMLALSERLSGLDASVIVESTKNVEKAKSVTRFDELRERPWLAKTRAKLSAISSKAKKGKSQPSPKKRDAGTGNSRKAI